MELDEKSLELLQETAVMASDATILGDGAELSGDGRSRPLIACPAHGHPRPGLII